MSDEEMIKCCDTCIHCVYDAMYDVCWCEVGCFRVELHDIPCELYIIDRRSDY